MPEKDITGLGADHCRPRTCCWSRLRWARVYSERPPGTMSLVESEAAFFQRCDELASGLKGLLEAKHIRTFRKLAFAIGTPQSAPSEVDFQAFAAEVYSMFLR